MENTEITIENMQEKDFDEVIEFALSTDELQSSDTPAFYDKEELSELIKSPHDIYLVARVNGKFAGFRLATFNPYLKEAYLIDLAVKEKFRKLGVAQALYDETFKKLRAQDCHWAWCIVHEDNVRMQNYIEKKGFKRGRKFYMYAKWPV